MLERGRRRRGPERRPVLGLPPELGRLLPELLCLPILLGLPKLRAAKVLHLPVRLWLPVLLLLLRWERWLSTRPSGGAS